MPVAGGEEEEDVRPRELRGRGRLLLLLPLAPACGVGDDDDYKFTDQTRKDGRQLSRQREGGAVLDDKGQVEPRRLSRGVWGGGR